jgi:hypothetical protein
LIWCVLEALARLVVWWDSEEVFKELKRKQTNTNEHETKTNEQRRTNRANKANEQGLFGKYPPNAPPVIFFLFFDPPSFFLANFLTTDAGMITKCTPRYSFWIS